MTKKKASINKECGGVQSSPGMEQLNSEPGQGKAAVAGDCYRLTDEEPVAPAFYDGAKRGVLSLDQSDLEITIENLAFESVEEEVEEVKTPTVISFKVDDPMVAEYIREMQERMGFGSQREVTLFLLELGITSLKVASASSLNIEDFARALWRVGRFGLRMGCEALGREEDSAVGIVLRRYEQWRLGESRRGRAPMPRVRTTSRRAEVPEL